MDRTHVYRFTMWHTPSNMAKIATTLARRRLRPQRLELSLGSEPDADQFELELYCHPSVARAIEHQIRRMVGLTSLNVHMVIAAPRASVADAATATDRDALNSPHDSTLAVAAG